jgi:hypothetical protein
MTVITAAGFGGSSVPAIQIGTSQDLAYNAAGGANKQSAAFGAQTTLIEVAAHVTGSGVRIATGVNPDATSGTNKLLPGSGTWFFVVAPGWKLSAVSDDATAGTINITEAASLG